MKAAIYARRSTDEHQAESLTVQVEQAKAYIADRGWRLVEGAVFVDDAISRAEFKKRPGLLALLAGAGRGDFNAVITRDESRLGGEQNRTGIVVQDILDYDVRLFYYYKDEEVTIDGALSKFVMSVRAFAAELEREKTAQRTHEHLQLKARRGLNVGGRCYGYDNYEILGEDGKRSHVEYRINEEQAEVLREIFRMYASGMGLRGIAKQLNDQGVKSPTVKKRGSGTWSPSCIREMLRRERYCGVLIWGRESKEYRHGTRVRVKRPECEWERADDPALRIIPEELWDSVQSRIAKTQRFTGRKGPAGPNAKYLLSGLSKCGECGGPIQVVNGKLGKKLTKVYVCSRHRAKGNAVCANTARRSVDAINEAVISWIKINVLSEAVVVETLAEVRRRMTSRAEHPDIEVAALKKELARVRKEAARYTEALATTDERPAIVMEAITVRDRRAREIETELAAIQKAPQLAERELKALEQQARHRLDEFHELLARNPVEARKAVEALLEGPLTFTPFLDQDGKKRISVEGPVSIGTLFTTVGDPNGIRTRVAGVKGQCPRPTRRWGRVFSFHRLSRH